MFHVFLRRRKAIDFRLYFFLAPTAFLSLLMIRKILGEISSSHGDDYEDDCLLGCCAV
jgi:hypothetical protein